MYYVRCCVFVLYVFSAYFYFFFFKQMTAYEMRISDWSSDVCSSDLIEQSRRARPDIADDLEAPARCGLEVGIGIDVEDTDAFDPVIVDPPVDRAGVEALVQVGDQDRLRVDTRRAQAQIVAEDAAVRIGEIAVEPSLPQDRKSTRLNSSH